MADCVEYLNVASVRAEFGDDVADETDASIQRRIDQLSALLEDKLGHTFGRALLARSTADDTVEVQADRLIIGGDTYPFATFTTLYDLVVAANAAGATYSLELLPRLRADTPTQYLRPLSATTCGPSYAQRVVLCSRVLYSNMTGTNQAYLFLPLPPHSVVALWEDGVALTSSAYWLVPGDPWLIRKGCGCLNSCQHSYGHWSQAYPGNIALAYVPQLWGYVPGALTGILLEAFSAKAGVAPFEAENFGDYSYRRPAVKPAAWNDILGGAEVRRYSVRFHP